MDFNHNAPAIKYVQHDKNTRVLSSLASALYDSREHVVEKAIAYWIEESFKSASLGYLDRIKFDNKMMTYRVREEGDKNLRYNMIKWKKMWILYLNEISDHVSLVKLIYNYGNTNHAISNIGCWIYNSN